MKTPLSLQSIVSVSDSQVSCELSGEAAILNFNKGVYYGLDPVGARIWQALQKPVRVVELKKQLLSEYAVDEEICEKDLLALLAKLMDQDLVIVR